MAYYAKKRLNDNNFIERVCDVKKPKAEVGFEWVSIDSPLDVQLYVEPVEPTADELIAKKVYDDAANALAVESKIIKVNGKWIVKK